MPEAHDEAGGQDAVVPSPDDEQRLADDAENRRKRIDEQIRYLIRVMQDRFPHPPKCPWCGHDHYGVGDLEEMYPRDGGVFGPSVFAVFPVTCSTCGYIWLFNASTAGVSATLDRAVNGEDISDADLPPKIEHAYDQLELAPTEPGEHEESGS